MNILRAYLEECHKSLLQDFRRSTAASSHGGDLGENREQLLVDFVNLNQPRRLFAHRGGQVIGLGSAPSQQIDILITHDSTIEFRAHQKTYRIAEAILAAIAVKSDLTSQRLKEDFFGLASIPTPSHSVLKLSHSEHDKLFQTYASSFPVRMMIGWTGATKETLLSALNDLSKPDSSIPVDRFPDVVTVLDRGFALQLLGKKEFLKGRSPRENVRWAPVPDSAGSAWYLAWLLNQVSSGSGWAAKFTVDLSPYWDEST